MTRPASSGLSGRSFEVAGDGDPRGMITTVGTDAQAVVTDGQNPA